MSKEGEKLPAHWCFLCGSAYQTVIRQNKFEVQTPEHLLAAAMLLNIDNLIIHIDGPEIPILDGSAWPWVQKIRSAGITTQDALAYYASIQPQHITMGQSRLDVEPSDSLSLTVSIEFKHPAIGHQSATFKGTDLLFQLAPAQTFGFKSDLPKLKQMGLAKGASLKNTLVYDQHGLINTQKIRYRNEALRHKALDIIGDFSLLNQRVRADINCHRPSHSLNQHWLKAQMP